MTIHGTTSPADQFSSPHSPDPPLSLDPTQSNYIPVHATTPTRKPREQSSATEQQCRPSTSSLFHPTLQSEDDGIEPSRPSLLERTSTSYGCMNPSSEFKSQSLLSKNRGHGNHPLLAEQEGLSNQTATTTSTRPEDLAMEGETRQDETTVLGEEEEEKDADDERGKKDEALIASAHTSIPESPFLVTHGVINKNSSDLKGAERPLWLRIQDEKDEEKGLHVRTPSRKAGQRGRTLDLLPRRERFWIHSGQSREDASQMNVIRERIVKRGRITEADTDAEKQVDSYNPRSLKRTVAGAHSGDDEDEEEKEGGSKYSCKQFDTDDDMMSAPRTPSKKKRQAVEYLGLEGRSPSTPGSWLERWKFDTMMNHSSMRPPMASQDNNPRPVEQPLAFEVSDAMKFATPTRKRIVYVDELDLLASRGEGDEIEEPEPAFIDSAALTFRTPKRKRTVYVDELDLIASRDSEEEIDESSPEVSGVETFATPKRNQIVYADELHLGFNRDDEDNLTCLSITTEESVNETESLMDETDSLVGENDSLVGENDLLVGENDLLVDGTEPLMDLLEVSDDGAESKNSEEWIDRSEEWADEEDNPTLVTTPRKIQRPLLLDMDHVQKSQLSSSRQSSSAADFQTPPHKHVRRDWGPNIRPPPAPKGLASGRKPMYFGHSSIQSPVAQKTMQRPQPLPQFFE
ncbi:hypothetical protein BGX28_002973 [Mortierella sp. GBA30]|nr:hypothetical protein BGX28_002973 [Mortierella sp. GBA30]